MKFRLAVIATASALAFDAQADTFDRGLNSPLAVGVDRTAVGSFDGSDLLAFGEPAPLFATIAVINHLPVLVIDDGTVTLFRGGPVDISVGSFAFDGTTAYATHALASTDGGKRGGLYALNSADPSAPHPDAFVLMLAGLSMVGFLTLHRRPASESR